MKIKVMEKMTVVYIEKNLDGANCSELRSQVISLIAEDKRDIVINMAGAKYTNSFGLGVLIFLTKIFRRYNRNLKLTSIQPNVMTIVETSSLDQLWEIYEIEDQVVASFGD